MARAMLHAGLPDRVLRALDPLEDVSPTEQATARLLRGIALAALGREADAVALLSQVFESSIGVQRTEAGYELAKAHWRAGRLHEAETLLALLLDADRSEGSGLYVAHALELYGRIELERRRRPVAARHFLDALETLPDAYVPLRAALLHGLASIAVDTLDLRLFSRARRGLASLTWPVAATALRAEVRRIEIAGELLLGNEAGAWTIAYEQLRTAPAGSRYVAALLDAVLVSRAAGERFTPDRLAFLAADHALHVDWTSLGGSVLLTAVREACNILYPSASDMLALYEALPRTSTRSELDELHSQEVLARAALAATRGLRVDQVAAIRRAAMLSREMGNHYAEVAALLSLLEVEADDEALHRVDKLTSVVPRSWLRRRYERLAERARGPEQLSPTERRVMYAICDGRSTAEIAERFGRSKNTIRNQTRRVYEAMNVRTRSALVSRCAAMGLLACDR